MQSSVGTENPISSGSKSGSDLSELLVGQRVHFAGDTRRIGTVKYVGAVEGYEGKWVGVDWDNGDGKHDGSHNGVRYFEAQGPKTASFVRPHNLSFGIPLLKALEIRYHGESTKEEEDEMYVLSATNKRVSIQLLGKDKIQNKLSRFEELTSASLAYFGVSSAGPQGHINTTIPRLKELDLTGNLLSDWREIAAICKELPALITLNLSYNIMSHDISGMPLLNHIKVLVLNHTGISWKQVEMLKDSLPLVEELHLMGNKLREIAPLSSDIVHGFDYLRLLNLENNFIVAWDEILKLSQLKRLEQLFLNNNCIGRIWYPDHNSSSEPPNGHELLGESCRPFQNLRCLLVGGNKIEDLASIDSLNFFPKLLDIRLSENPIADPGKGGVPRFVLIGRLAKVETLNGSQVSPRERKDSEIRYVRLVMSKSHDSAEEIKKLHPRFAELKSFHGIEDQKATSGATGPQKMASGLISITLKCVAASIGEKAPLTKKLPATTTVGKLKILCESFFKIKSIKPKLFLQEQGSPFPTLLDDDMASLIDFGVGNESTILVDEDC
ncbi:PREDICTED: tubulin-folding cofactor E [Nicotiana attenuata]|uniref:Tubulin-folding cofactor e n=1 Tax=Nicotiana attenuata TaxID=49451 RepID=A0A1J6II73_NICAT|nr:PREDICTED: tubulin-folding cofactor E [Nicotiana attenuata]OIT04566.1 tubulin-folding cofactor e [Nicotiana attenuata]